MTGFRRNKTVFSLNIWPGFVDALSTVVLVFTFVIVGFLSSQIYLSQMISDKDSTMTNLQTKFANLCELYDSEVAKCKNLQNVNVNLTLKVRELNQALDTLRKMFNNEAIAAKQAKSANISLQDRLDILNKQLKEVLESLAIEKKSNEAIKKENIKLNELTRFNTYRSEFFEKLRDVVRDKEGIKVVGDRFIFQSELFFESASDELSEAGRAQIAQMAKIINEIGTKIPNNIRWILRVDGHTDARKISAGRFQSNWELSSARAISVVKRLILEGVAPSHLVAAGFGEFQPISKGTSEEDYARNRRIEFKLDER